MQEADTGLSAFQLKKQNEFQKRPEHALVLPYMSIGNWYCASDRPTLSQMGVTHVLTLTMRSLPEEIHNHFQCKNIPLFDTSDQEVMQHFNAAFQFISEARERDQGHILVHCAAGISRSSTMVLAWLMHDQKLSLRDSYLLLKSKREVIHPNMGFVRQLMRLETDLFKVSTSSLTWEEWPNTIYERVEQLGFKVPHDDKVMYLLEEKASRTYLDKYGQPNPHFTHDAGLDGNMGLHLVEMYEMKDFVWLDELVLEFFPTPKHLS